MIGCSTTLTCTTLLHKSTTRCRTHRHFFFRHFPQIFRPRPDSNATVAVFDCFHKKPFLWPPLVERKLVPLVQPRSRLVPAARCPRGQESRRISSTKRSCMRCLRASSSLRHHYRSHSRPAQVVCLTRVFTAPSNSRGAPYASANKKQKFN